jgi:hypothetical protein
MDLAPLQQLKQKLLHDEKLDPVWSFFMDHFADRSEFIALGERAHHALVEAVVAQVGQQLYASDGAVSGLLLTRVADQRFLHGGFFMGGRPGGVIYFEDAHIGLVAVAETPPSIQVKYARFSGRPVHKSREPSRN